jgi:hypothetical protein
MKILYTYLLIIFLSSALSSQEWSEPIQISPDTMSASNPDLIIDNRGVYHCVWSHKLEPNWRKIYYSKSEDQGETWSEPFDVSQNNSLWMENPHIAVDSSYNIFITYDYNVYIPSEILIKIKIFDDYTWSESETVSTNMPGSAHNKLVIDSDSRIYSFWSFNGNSYYRLLENNNWSEIFHVFPTDNNYHTVQKIQPDGNNNLHAVGTFHYEGQTHYDNRKIYIKYSLQSQRWTDHIFINENNNSWVGEGIEVDNDQNPHIVWHEPTGNEIPYNDATFYKHFDGTNWSIVDTVVEDPKHQTIAIDHANNIFIANSEKTDTGNQVVCYQKLNDTWEGSVIDESYAFWSLKLIRDSNYLLLLYDKSHVGGGDSEICLSKLEIPANSIEPTIGNISAEISLKNQPNPFHTRTNIHFELIQGGHTTLEIYDLRGRLVNTLIKRDMPPGNYSVSWNGINAGGQVVAPGIYLYRLRVNNKTKTRSLIFQ